MADLHSRTVYFSDPPMEVSADVQLAMAVAQQQQDNQQIIIPDHERVVIHTCEDQLTQVALGIHYQKCGGGRRVIRRHRGSY